MTKHLILLLFIGLVFFGCYSGAGIYSVKNDSDPYNETNFLKQVDNCIMGFMNEDNANIYCMNIYYDINAKSFYLNIDVTRDSWLFIKQIIFLADGEKIVFPFSNKHRDVVGGGTVSEWDVIPIDEDTLKKLIFVGKVTCRFVGSDYYHDLNDLSKIQSRWKTYFNDELPKYK